MPVRLDRAPQRGAAFALTRASRRARTRSIGSRSRTTGSSLIFDHPPAAAPPRGSYLRGSFLRPLTAFPSRTFPCRRCRRLAPCPSRSRRARTAEHRIGCARMASARSPAGNPRTDDRLPAAITARSRECCGARGARSMGQPADMVASMLRDRPDEWAAIGRASHHHTGENKGGGHVEYREEQRTREG